MGWGLLQGIGQGMSKAADMGFEHLRQERLQEWKQQQTQAHWDREDTHRAEDQAAAVASKQDDRAYDLVKQQNQHKLQMEMERMKQRTANGKFGAAKPGINPDTKLPGYFQTNQSGDTRWLDAVPPQKNGVTVGPDGTIQIGGSGGELSTSAQTKVEKDLLDTTDILARLEDASGSFDANYQTLGNKFSSMVTGGRSLLGLDVSPGDQKDYNSYIDHRARIGGITTIVRNQLFGAALTDTEKASAAVFLPDVQKDNPLELKQKFNTMLRTTKRASARLNYIRKNGLEMKSVPLESMDQIMADAAKRLDQQIRQSNPGLPEEAVRQQVIDGVRREFGLVK
ncbi:hypothetical protein [Pontibacterium sp.]|uniref:hypothetical protein n=1 Tax=Pontibacterium sp. TaxID=2036026 RepID=UPI003566ED29